MRTFGLAMVATIAAAGFVSQSHAATLNADGNVTPDVIFGSGNANGSFTGITVDDVGLELALRAKKRFPTPANDFNYDGDRTYSFENNGGRADRSVFNIEFAINTDVNDLDGSPEFSVANYQLVLEYDIDPTANTDFVATSIALGFLGVYGFNDTPNGGGTAPVPPTDPENAGQVLGYLLELSALSRSANVLQGSQNLGFSSIFPDFNDPDANGIFDFRLSAFSGGSEGSQPQLVGSTDISVVVGDVSPVPVPAGLPLMLAGLGGFAILRRRQRS